MNGVYGLKNAFMICLFCSAYYVYVNCDMLIKVGISDFVGKTEYVDSHARFFIL